MDYTEKSTLHRREYITQKEVHYTEGSTLHRNKYTKYTERSILYGEGRNF